MPKKKSKPLKAAKWIALHLLLSKMSRKQMKKQQKKRVKAAAAKTGLFEAEKEAFKREREALAWEKETAVQQMNEAMPKRMMVLRLAGATLKGGAGSRTRALKAAAGKEIKSSLKKSAWHHLITPGLERLGEML